MSNLVDEQIQSANKPNVKVTAAAFGAKCSSKKEVYRFLTSDCRVYLAPYHTMTVWHMRDLAGKNRKRIYCDAVRTIIIPQI